MLLLPLQKVIKIGETKIGDLAKRHSFSYRYVIFGIFTIDSIHIARVRYSRHDNVWNWVDGVHFLYDAYDW